MGAPVRTLADALERVADRHESGYSHVTEGGATRFESFGELYSTASRIGRALQARGVRKADRVALVLGDSQDFIDTFFGAVVIGAVPVPIAPPARIGRSDTYSSTVVPIVEKTRPRMIVTDDRLQPILALASAELPGVPILTLDLLLTDIAESDAHVAVDIHPEDTAFLQFTSGSTSRPRGVRLSHANLVANLRAISGEHGLQSTGQDYGVSWLPLYHDMGLIGKVFVPMYAGMRGAAFMPPALFLKRPLSWLRQISLHKGTITFAPNFAYSLCGARADRRGAEGLDLSSLRVAGCGAEPIRYEVLSTFARKLQPFGFRPEALLPCYGLAEHTLAVTFSEVGRGMATDRVLGDVLATGEARRAPPAGAPGGARDDPPPGVVIMVSCGRVFPGHQVRIVDPDGAPLPERRVGDILVSGPSLMEGYFEDDAATTGALRDGWLNTGDKAYLADGHLYVCGRSKDLIIVHGRNYYPQDIEWQAAHVEGIREGSVVAFGLEDAALGRERIVVAAETKALTDGQERVAQALRSRILEALSLKVDDVLLLAPHTLPKTSSGKLQRARSRELFRAGTLGGSESQPRR